MRIALARHAVSGPARMRDAYVPISGVAAQSRILQHLDLADGPHALEVLRAVEHREPGRS